MSASHLNILLIEDETLFSKLVIDLLSGMKDFSFTAKAAGRLDEGLAVLAEDKRIDVVLLDLDLPDSGGLDTVIRLRAAAPWVPVVVITGVGGQEVALETLRQGAQDYLEKLEVQPSLLIRVMRYAIERKQMETRLSFHQAELERLVEERTADLRRANLALRALSDANEAVIKITDETELMERVCRIAVEQAGYRLAWVGLVEHDQEKSVRPVASYGFDEGYIESLRITWADTAHGGGPTGRAIRSGRPQVAHNLPTDPDYGPWKEMALAHGYASSLALPIMEGTTCLGALNIYSSRSYAFDEEELGLLGELTQSLSLGISSIRARRDRQKALQALRDNELRLRTIFDVIPNPTIVYDMNGQSLFVNIAFENTFGWSRDELLNKKINFIPPESLPETIIKLEQIKKGEPVIAFETKRLAKDGRKLDVLLNTAPFREDGKQIGNIVSFADITARKQAEEARRKDEARLESLLKISQYRSANEQEILDNALEEAIGLTESRVGYIYHYHEERREFVLNTWSKEVMAECSVVEPLTVYQLDQTGIWGEAVRQRRAIIVNDFAAPNPCKKGYPSGHVVLNNFCTVPIFMEGQIVAVVGMANKKTDYEEADIRQLTLLMDSVWKILERQRAIIGYKESEERYRNLVDTISEGLIEVDKDNRVTFCNKHFSSSLGYEQENLLGINTMDLMDESNKALLRSQWAQRQKGKASKYELGWNKADGTTLHTLISAAPLRDTQGHFKGSLCLVTDITERKFLESQLLQAQKLEAIGQLAAGIAHEINTPAQYVTDNTRFLRESLLNIIQLIGHYGGLLDQVKRQGQHEVLVSELEKMTQDIELDYLLQEIPVSLEQTLEGLERITKIVRSMKEFAHPGPATMTDVDINKAIENTITVARNEWKYVAEMETNLDPELPLVPCVPGEVNQVLLNIIVNAAHAIGDALKDGKEEKGIIRISTRRAGDQAEIRISDTGPGIPAAIQNRVFDPFFTTKEPGKGTGQGLAISHAVIVDKHKGKLSFATKENEGTTFVILLPL